MTLSAHAQSADPFLWLEEVDGDKAMAFVNSENQRSLDALTQSPRFKAIQTEIREVLDSRDRIPLVAARGPWLYNFWQDAANPRGLWRRTSWAEFRKPQPTWETVLDVDALARDEKENWVWSGARCLPPAYEKCLIEFSRGGGDAVVVREFDVATKSFVAGGFTLPEAKSDTVWRDADTLLVGTDFGPGSMTASGYPRIVKRWQRGTPLSAAVTVFEGSETDVGVDPWVDHTPGYFREGVRQAIEFFRSATFVRRGDELVRIDVPTDARPALVRDWLLVRPRSDWTVGGRTVPRGALAAIKADAFARGERDFELLFAPTPTRSLASYSVLRDGLVLNVMDDVKSQVLELRHDGKRWLTTPVTLPGTGAATASAVDPFTSNQYWITYQDFLTPSSLLLGELGRGKPEVLKTLPAMFDAAGMMVEQQFARSADGTRVPYFIVRPKKAAPGAPALLYGYGGFEVSMQPFYSGAYGRAWLARGGTFVLANIRGGGEYGPAWHQAALKHQRQRAFDDFIAIAEDLVRRGVTTPSHLGIMGGSNGGLLVGAVMAQRPELFGAVVAQVPLFDMQRYHRLLAGASWVAEYGNPDDAADWAVIARYSPYQNLRRETRYPALLVTTSTRDDRVHPGHARKLVARMRELGHPVWYYENTEGGHASAANNEQRARVRALEMAFLWQQLGSE